MNMGVSHTLLYMYTSFTYTVSYSHIHANVHIDIDTHLHLSIRIRLPTRIHGHQNPKDFDFVLPGCPAWLSCCGNSSCLRGPAVPNFARRISGRGQWHFKPSGSWISRKRWWESSVKCFRRGFGMIWTLKRSEIKLPTWMICARQAKKLHPDRNPHGQAAQVGNRSRVRGQKWNLLNSCALSGSLSEPRMVWIPVKWETKIPTVQVGSFCNSTLDPTCHLSLFLWQEFSQLRADFEEALQLLEQQCVGCAKCFRAEGPEISWRAPNSQVENYWVFASHVQAIYEHVWIFISNLHQQFSFQIWLGKPWSPTSLPMLLSQVRGTPAEISPCWLGKS